MRTFYSEYSAFFLAQILMKSQYYPSVFFSVLLSQKPLYALWKLDSRVKRMSPKSSLLPRKNKKPRRDSSSRCGGQRKWGVNMRGTFSQWRCLPSGWRLQLDAQKMRKSTFWYFSNQSRLLLPARTESWWWTCSLDKNNCETEQNIQSTWICEGYWNSHKTLNSCVFRHWTGNTGLWSLSKETHMISPTVALALCLGCLLVLAQNGGAQAKCCS